MRHKDKKMEELLDYEEKYMTLQSEMERIVDQCNLAIVRYILTHFYALFLFMFCRKKETLYYRKRKSWKLIAFP